MSWILFCTVLVVFLVIFTEVFSIFTVFEKKKYCPASASSHISLRNATFGPADAFSEVWRDIVSDCYHIIDSPNTNEPHMGLWMVLHQI